jgi:hypothetical protein
LHPRRTKCRHNCHRGQRYIEPNASKITSEDRDTSNQMQPQLPQRTEIRRTKCSYNCHKGQRCVEPNAATIATEDREMRATRDQSCGQVTPKPSAMSSKDVPRSCPGAVISTRVLRESQHRAAAASNERDYHGAVQPAHATGCVTSVSCILNTLHAV